MIKPRYLAGFTGHRAIEHSDIVREAVATQLSIVKTQIERSGGVLELYASAAYGADLIACEEATHLGIPVHLVLPKAVVINSDTGVISTEVGFAADFWKQGEFLTTDWERALRLIQAAENGDGGGTLRVTNGSQMHPECYYDAGLQMLEPLDVLIAVWNRKPAEGLGGTEHWITLAAKHRLPHIIISPESGKAEPHHLSRLASPDDKSRTIFAELETFSRDCADRGETQEETALQFFKRLEASSEKHSKFFRHSLVCTILWHGAATLVAAIAAVLPQTGIHWKIALASLAALELSLVVSAYQRSRRMRRDGTHERWMESRFAAELMRAILHSAGLLDPLHPLIARHHPRWRRFAITAGLLIQRETERHDWSSARVIYLENRLRHQDPKIGQIAYFTKKQAEAEPHFRLTNRWGTNLGIAAIFFVIGALVSKLYVITAKTLHWPYPPTVDDSNPNFYSWLIAVFFGFLPIALPLAAGVAISLRTALDSGRRTYRYKELAERLTVAATEEVLLDELVEWHLAERQNGAH